MIVVCGEALFDVFAAGDTPEGLTLSARVGGSPFNVAVGLARLGQPAALLTQIGHGFLGDRLMRALREEGVGTGLILRSDAPTTLSLVGVDDQGLPAYAFYGERGADCGLPLTSLDAWPAGVRAVHLGSYAAVVGTTAAPQRELVRRLQGGPLVSYDPNVRLGVEPRIDVWRDQLDWMLPRTHLLKISEEDLSLLQPGTAPADFAAQALDQGVGCVVVTRGAHGASAWTCAHAVSVPAAPTAVIDTVGAGDAFQAALLTWLAEQGRLTPDAPARLNEQALAEALTFSSRAAALTCSRRGADLPRRGDLPRTQPLQDPQRPR